SGGSLDPRVRRSSSARPTTGPVEGGSHCRTAGDLLPTGGRDGGAMESTGGAEQGGEVRCLAAEADGAALRVPAPPPSRAVRRGFPPGTGVDVLGYAAWHASQGPGAARDGDIAAG